MSAVLSKPDPSSYSLSLIEHVWSIKKYVFFEFFFFSFIAPNVTVVQNFLS